MRAALVALDRVAHDRSTGRLAVPAGQSLYYLGEHTLAHKILAVAEAEGAARASYALKVLQSDGGLSIASTGKDSVTGDLVTKTYRVSGPVALFLTTTAPSLDDELANRCVVLGVDEDQAQTRAILAAQRQAQTLDGLLARTARDDVRALHANAQRLLEPVAVVNSLAPSLAFADGRTRARRDHAKLLTLIRRPGRADRSPGPGSRLDHHGGGCDTGFRISAAKLLDGFLVTVGIQARIRQSGARHVTVHIRAPFPGEEEPITGPIRSQVPECFELPPE